MSNSRSTLEGEADPDLRKLVKPLGGPCIPPTPSLLQCRLYHLPPRAVVIASAPHHRFPVRKHVPCEPPGMCPGSPW